MESAVKLTEKGQRDYILIQRVLENNDQQAYSELLNHYHDSLYYMMLKMSGDPLDADDLTIEAFGKAFKNLKHYTPDYAFSTWLFKIATNNCIDYMRKKSKVDSAIKVDKSDSDYKMTSHVPSDELDPEEMIIKEQKIDLVHKIVKHLKPHYRKLIELKYFKEYSYEEICQEIDLPLGTIKAQIFRAKELLFNILKENRELI